MVEVCQEGDDPHGIDARPWRSQERLALATFVGAVAVAVPVLFHIGREQWFFLDEWDFIAARDLDQPSDLLRPHNEHWTTVPIVTYRLIFQVVGANHYWPYLVPVIAAHLIAASLLRVVMRRAGVEAWVATAAAVAFVFLGAGREDILWGFQITFTGSLALGLAQMVLAGHGGGLGRRDAVAVACGVGAVACSGIGIGMVAGVAVACLLRREVARAAIQGGLPLLAVGTWYLIEGAGADDALRPTLGEAAAFVGWTFVDSLEGLGRHTLVATLLAAAGIAGLIVCLGSVVRRSGGGGADGAELWRARADVVALAAAALAATAGTAWNRAAAYPAEHGSTWSRYIHITVALVLPAVALGAAWVGSRLPLPPLGTVLASLLLLVGLPANARSLDLEGVDRLALGSREQMLVLAAVATDLGTPADLSLDPVYETGLTAGWLQRATASGELPEAERPLPPDLVADAVTRLSFATVRTAPTGPCTPLGVGTSVRTGDVITVPGAQMAVVSPTDHGVGTHLFEAAPGVDPPRVILRAVRDVRVRSAHGAPGTLVEVCPAG